MKKLMRRVRVRGSINIVKREKSDPTMTIKRCYVNYWYHSNVFGLSPTFFHIHSFNPHPPPHFIKLIS
jgi:hypothetical protein